MQADLESVKRVLMELMAEAKGMRKDELGKRFGPKEEMGEDRPAMLKEAVMGDAAGGEAAEMPPEEGAGPAELEAASEESAPMAAAAQGAGGDDDKDVELIFQKLGLRR